jgi:hypothetical protein
MCPVDTLCDGAGACKSEIGISCQEASDCFSGHCIDGFCCDRACADACQTCANPEEPGICGAPVNMSDPPVCAGSDSVCLGQAACAKLDQRQPRHGGTGQIGEGWNAAQSLTVGRSGRLAALKLRVECESQATLIIEVRELAGSEPNGRILTSARLKSEEIAPRDAVALGFGLAVFNPPVTLAAGARVGFLLNNEGGSCWTNELGFFTNEDPYPRGVRFTRRYDGPWDSPPGDLTFETLMLP